VATSVPILVFLGLSVLQLGPMYARDRRQTKASLNASALWGRGITSSNDCFMKNNNSNDLFDGGVSACLQCTVTKPSCRASNSSSSYCTVPSSASSTSSAFHQHVNNHGQAAQKILHSIKF